MAELRIQNTANPEPYPPLERQGFDNTLLLNGDDPFERAVMDIVEMNRRKRKDYADDDDPFSNFKDSAFILALDGFGQTEAVLFNIAQKVARLRSLRRNGRMGMTFNESVQDTYLDLAVYSVILYAMVEKNDSTD